MPRTFGQNMQHLTLTSVVFELLLISFVVYVYINLTLTSVVFE